MNFDEYQALAEKTARKEVDVLQRYANYGMGISGEAGEACDYLKKVIFHEHLLDRRILMKELGDVLWYIAGTASTASIKLYELGRITVHDSVINFHTYQWSVESKIQSEKLENLALQLMYYSGGVSGYLEEVISKREAICETILLAKLEMVLRSLTAIASKVDISLEEIAVRNIEKLSQRYPEGFDIGNSMNRAE